VQVLKKLKSMQKLVCKIKFEKTIEMEEEKSAVDRCLEIITTLHHQCCCHGDDYLRCFDTNHGT